jgi:serine protein kinase
MSIVDDFKDEYEKKEVQVLTIDEYLNLCKTDPTVYSTAAERMVAAIGEPELVDTSKDPRLSRIFTNRTLRVYPAFKEFYGMENTIEQIVGYFKHAAQGLEEKKQIIYLLGPVGGGKSSLAERLKELMEANPIYVLATEKGDPSPVFETPLALFSNPKYANSLKEQYNIDSRYTNTVLSPWALKRLKEYKGDISKFRVLRLMPSKLEQIAIMKTEPGDENNQDISTLVGKVDIRMLEKHSQNDPDAYSFSGGLCRANQGLLEFVEMFKAPIKVLHPLLTATQEGNYIGTEAISAIPFQGIVLAHSNESEWQTFRSNKNNEAFLDRICVITVPYCLRVEEEKKSAVRAADHRNAGTILDLDPHQGTRELDPVLENARLQWREHQGKRPQGQDHPRVPRHGWRERGHGWAIDALRLQNPIANLQLQRRRSRGRPCAFDVCA